MSSSSNWNIPQVKKQQLLEKWFDYSKRLRLIEMNSSHSKSVLTVLVLRPLHTYSNLNFKNIWIVIRRKQCWCINNTTSIYFVYRKTLNGKQNNWMGDMSTRDFLIEILLRKYNVKTLSRERTKSGLKDSIFLVSIWKSSIPYGVLGHP